MAFKEWVPPNGLPEGKILKMDTLTQNSLNTIKSSEIWRNLKKKETSLISHPSLRQSFRS